MTAAKTVSPVPAFTLTFRASEHPNAPELQVTGSTPSELQDRVDTALTNSLFAIIGKCQEQMTAGFVLGNVLGASPVDAPKASTSETPPTEAAAQALLARREAAAEPAAAPPATPWGAATHDPAGDWPRPETSAPPAAPAAPATSGAWPPKPAWGA